MNELVLIPPLGKKTLLITQRYCHSAQVVHLVASALGPSGFSLALVPTFCVCQYLPA